jgi:hypothetical protein
VEAPVPLEEEREFMADGIGPDNKAAERADATAHPQELAAKSVLPASATPLYRAIYWLGGHWRLFVGLEVPEGALVVAEDAERGWGGRFSIAVRLVTRHDLEIAKHAAEAEGKEAWAIVERQAEVIRRLTTTPDQTQQIAEVADLMVAGKRIRQGRRAVTVSPGAGTEPAAGGGPR